MNGHTTDRLRIKVITRVGSDVMVSINYNVFDEQ